MTEDAGLPAGLDAAWGLRNSPPRKPRPHLTLDRVVTAAIQIADTSGLATVSMSRVAAELGATTMALYRHVSSKDELLALMADAVFQTPPEPPTPGAAPAPGQPSTAGEDWRGGLTYWAYAHLGVLRRHPWVLRIPADGPPAMPNQLTWLDRALATLGGTALAPATRLSVVMLVSGFVRNAATQENTIMDAARARGTDPAELMTAYTRLLAELVDPVRLPALHDVISGGALSRQDEPDGEFSFGLARILDGVAGLI